MGLFFDPYSDYGFKKLFGEEVSKDILIDFLNTMLPERHQIADLTFSDKEIVPSSVMDRGGSYDIYCTAQNEERFIVEMQKARFPTFKERALIYSVWSLQNQIRRGEEWGKKQRFSAIYFVGILNFVFKEEYDDEGKPIPNKLYTNVRLKDDDNTLFYGGLTMKFLQMPLFTKTEDELETHFDKWLYFLKNLPSFDHIPRILNEPVFSHAFEVAKFGNMNPEDRQEYDKTVWNAIAYYGAMQEKEDEGKIKGKAELIRAMFSTGLSIEQIAEMTKQDIDEIKRLLS
jgi:predicted transposase/invertase (TIGR01784 family)